MQEKIIQNELGELHDRRVLQHLYEIIVETKNNVLPQPSRGGVWREIQHPFQRQAVLTARSARNVEMSSSAIVSDC